MTDSNALLLVKIEQEKRRRQRVKQNLHVFLKTASTEEWDWTPSHLQLIIRHLEAIKDGTLKRLMIFCPPRHGKSALATVRFPVYFLEKNQNKRAVVATHTISLSHEFSHESRAIAHQRRIEINPKKDTQDIWRLAGGGSYRAIGVGTGISGRGADLMIIDDPIKSAEMAYSETYRDKTYTWYIRDIVRRLEPDGAIILIMTRWHEDDLAGRILDSPEASQWTTINLPALALQNDLIGRKEGEALWGKRYPKHILEDWRHIDPQGFEALYQQNPTMEQGNLIQTNNIQYYAEHERPVGGYTVCSWDTALGEKESNDYTVGTTWLFFEHKFYLLNVVRGHFAFNELKTKIVTEASHWRANSVLIENKAGGLNLQQELSRTTAINPIMGTPIKDKVARTRCVTGLFDSGKIYLPTNAQWMANFLSELKQFPLAKHDDQVDSVSLALGWLQERFGYIQTNKLPQFQPKIISHWSFGNESTRNR